MVRVYDTVYDRGMATVKKGVLSYTGQWAKHLRRLKCVFWRRERQAGRITNRRDIAER